LATTKSLAVIILDGVPGDLLQQMRGRLVEAGDVEIELRLPLSLTFLPAGPA
jgi:hypothetical protein